MSADGHRQRLIEQPVVVAELIGGLARALPPAVHRLLWRAAAIAREHAMPIYLVGGPVRDLLVDRPITDLDLVIEGDAWPIAEEFQAATGGRLIRHAEFRTAAVELMQDDAPFAIDFVTARREVYPAPAVLPVVTPSDIADDLFRRDFTINTLALRLNTPDDIAMLDPFGGVRDLKAGVVRVLHDASFRDDPTRILRAARFAARLDFTVEPHTTGLITAAIDEQMIERPSAQRILHELWLTLDEPQPERTLGLLHDWAAFPQLRLIWSDAWMDQFPAARAATWPDVALRDLYLGLLIWPMSDVERNSLVSRYNLPAVARRLLDELPRVPLSRLSDPDIGAVSLERVLQPYAASTLRVLQLVAPPIVRANVARYLDTIRPLPPLVSGDVLRAYGVAPGPIYRTIFAELREAQLNGIVTTPEDARQWLERRLTDGGR